MQNSKANRKKQSKRTHMCAGRLIIIRLEMGYAPRDMYRSLDIPRRTYQDYEAGKRSIPEKVAVRVREMYRCDREWMANIPALIDEQTI